MSLFSEWIGWAGVAATLGAYALVSLGFLQGNDPAYQCLNVVGAICVAYDALKQKNWQPVVLNIVWATIALIALGKIFLMK